MSRSMGPACLVALVLGCGAAPHEPVEPASEPARAAAPAPSEREPARVTAPHGNPAVFGGPGFWCSARLAGEDTTVMECYRSRSTCDARRAAHEKAGKPWTPCRAADRAVCFVVRNENRQISAFHCFETERDCTAELPLFKRQLEDDKADTFSDCEWTAGVDLPARTRAVATFGR